MWPVSDAFLALVRTSHKSVVRVDILNDGGVIGSVYPVDGGVSIDSRRTVRRTLSMTVVDEDGSLTPGQGAVSGLLTPYGTELAVYRGVEYADGATEFTPLGVFVLTQVDVTEDESGEKLSLQGSDRSIRVSRNKFIDPYQVTAGTSLESALVALLRDRWVDVQTDMPTTGVALPTVVIEAQKGNDPWASAVTIAEAFGYDLAFSPDGIARMRTIPDPVEDDPVEIYQDGADAVLTAMTRTFDSARAFNGVIVASQGTNTDLPIRAIAWDENPNSITYRYGPFGEVPFFYESSLITTGEQAATTAAALLRKATGVSEAVSWNQIVNSAHDVLDVVRLQRDAKALDLVLLIDRLDVPLGPEGTMSAVARTQEVDGG
jgi:hypothetical protein